MVHASRSWRKDENAALTAFSALGIRSERLLWPCNEDQPTIANQQLFELISFAIRMSEPVFIEIPRTLLEKKCQRINLPKSLTSILKDMGELSGAGYIADEIRKRLNNCQKPVLVFGERLKHNHELIQETLHFCEKHQIPFASNLFAKGLIDEHHPLSLGTYNGVLSPAKTRDYIENQADYLLEICTSILPQDTSTAFGTKTYILHDFNNRTCLRGTATRCEDVLAVLKILNETQIDQKFQMPPVPDEGLNLPDSTEIQFCNIATLLNQFQSKNRNTFVYLPEVGNSFFSSFSLRTRASELGRSWLTNPFYAAMGTSLPYAHAVCKTIQTKGYSDIPLVLTGDGGFHFQLNELINFQRADLFLIILYFKNNFFHLGKMSDSKIYNSSSDKFDPIQLVKAYGGHGRKVSTARELFESLEQSINTKKGIHLYEIPVSTDENLQSYEVQIINTFIKAKSCVPESLIQWQKIGNKI
jgi:thiamine pyrophosphate-dependent acetolactate synthase large subunit-like protein